MGAHMTPTHAFLFITLCGVLGLLFRKNLLSICVSLLQILVGIFALCSEIFQHLEQWTFIVIALLALMLVIFITSLTYLSIRKRSTLNINEFGELRG